MIARPRPGLTLAVAAAALAGTTPMAPPAVADDEPLVEHCYTIALTDEQVANGEVSEIDCFWVLPDEPPMQMRGTITYAIVYDTDQFGSFLFVNSPPGATTCTGGKFRLHWHYLGQPDRKHRARGLRRSQAPSVVQLHWQQPARDWSLLDRHEHYDEQRYVIDRLRPVRTAAPARWAGVRARCESGSRPGR